MTVAGTPTSERQPGRFRRWYRTGLVLFLAGVVLVDAATLVVFVRDTRELSAIAEKVTDGVEAPSEQMRRLVEYVAHDVRPGRPDKYLLLPIFRPLRPTAMQVIQYGGDCSYKARAFIVLARRRGIAAHKVALHDRKGEPVHAVAVVDTERGEYVVDLLYGIVYENDDGSPISLDTLREDPEALARVIAERERSGLMRMGEYPLEKYVYSDVKSYNWKQNALASACYRGLSTLVGTGPLDRLPRPYLESEPALLVLVGSGMAVILASTPWLILRFADRRRARRAGTSSEPTAAV